MIYEKGGKFNASLGHAMKIARGVVNMSARDVASKIKVSTSHVSMLEAGTRFPSMDVLCSIGEAVGLSGSILLCLAECLDSGNIAPTLPVEFHRTVLRSADLARVDILRSHDIDAAS